ncbi:ArsB/NhaD family transporter [Herbiconiux sp. KACC 21604]|uniref:SLC13 family permease n=1 Tax=unclassified Herbiconiux TaxID=2618217 RepID=UPI001491B971|nr:SLC13 family permease [Herbiconiux sp. SALV-R1]QJU55498.1 arsenic transporter [Herbiconiux sp. SALV-R1]WPO86683.1 ArsB/NhaD family transporter [Herbiconiux sp. KACC 21604]
MLAAAGRRIGTILTVALLLAAAVVVATGFLPWNDFVALLERVAPVLAFVIGITIVAELASEAGVFTALAERLAGWGRGRVWLLWALVIALAVVSTAFLSLDTTAVLVTPVVVVLAQHVGIPPLPFALATVWLANTASLFLPVSNLTNLLAADRLGESPASFLAVSWAPGLVGVAATVAILSLVHRRSLRGSFSLPERTPVDDRVLLVFSAVVVAVLLPMLVSGIEVALVAGAGAVLLLGMFLVRRRSAIRPSLIPWQALGIALGLFVLVEAAQLRGLESVLAQVTGSGDDPLSLLHLAAVGALSANALNNLPAYLVLEPHADSSARIMALLIGTNLGPLVTPWASLATLLWHQRLTALGVTLSWPRFMGLGVIAVVVVVPLATLTLALVA